MKLFHPIADGIGRPARNIPRAVRLATLVFLLAAAMAVFGAHAALAADPSVNLSLSGSSVADGAPVTMTATVSSAAGVPSGTIGFFDAASPGPALGQVTLLPSGSNSSTGSVTVTLPSRSYSVYALYTPDLAAFFIGLTVPVSSQAQPLTVGTVLPIPRPTQVILAAPTDVDSTSPVTLTATVSEIPPGGIPTGTVQFTDTITGLPIPLGDVVLDSHGVAQLVIPNLSAGPHQIIASYGGSALDSPSSSLPVISTSHPPVDVTVTTVTDVVVSPSPIAAGDTVTITATITQTGAGAPAQPTGRVTFTSDSVHGTNVFLGSTDLGTAPDGLTAASNQAIIRVSGWQAGDYSITASYFGDLYDKKSDAAIPLSVFPPRPGTVVDYTGDTEVVFGHTATLGARITDHPGAPLAGRSVTFTLGTQSCTGTTDAAGDAACTLVVTQDPGDTAVSVDVPQDIQTEGASINLDFTVMVAPTAITVGFQPGPGTTALTATLLTEGAALPHQPVTLSLGSGTCTAVTNATGFATCSVPTIVGPPMATLAASFAGTTDYAASTDSHSVQLMLTPALAYTGAVTSPFHGAPTLSATLTDGTGTAMPGRTLVFTVGAQTCSATTNAAGAASCTIPSLTQHAGSYTVAVAYAGDVVSQPAAASSPFAITLAPTTLVAAAPVPGATTTTLSATLKEAATATALPGKPVTLSLGTASCSTTTSATGVATCAVATPTGASATLTATFVADLDYSGSSDTKSVTLLKPTASTYTGDTSSEYHDLVLVSGTLLSSGAAVSGQTVTFKIGTQTCTATTLSSGKAFCLILLTQPAGSYAVSMSYAGSPTYAASTTSTPFTIAREETALIGQVSDAVINGNSISLSAVLLEDSILPVANRTVTLKLGTASCTATTNLLGYATCSVPRASVLGPTTFTATFAGDVYYLPSSTSRSTIVCAFASGGSFVIGDRNSGSVSFWSSQWSKQNKLSHGDTPSSFKGWASGTFDASWGNDDDWSSDPGNSSSPPATLPAYMAVIQTSSSYKSGSRIYGDTVHIVVVKTNSGYAPNPGHDGTGTVVATVH